MIAVAYTLSPVRTSGSGAIFSPINTLPFTNWQLSKVSFKPTLPFIAFKHSNV